MRLSLELGGKINQVVIVTAIESSYYCHIMNSCFISLCRIYGNFIMSF